MRDIEFEGWEQIESTLRRVMPEMGYVLLGEMVGESGIQNLGRWDASLEDAIRRGDIDPADIQDEGKNDALLASCLAWIRRQVENNIAGRDRMVVRVRVLAPKAERQIAQLRFEARLETDDLDLGRGALQVAARTPQFEMRDLDTMSSAPALATVGVAHANLLRVASAQADMVMGMAERVVAVERAGTDRLVRSYENRIASLEAQIEQLRGANDALLAQVIDFRRAEVEAEVEQASERIAAADGSATLERGLDRIGEMVNTAVAIHQGLPPELGELLKSPQVRGVLANPRLIAILKSRPDAVEQLPALLDQVIEAVEAAAEEEQPS